MNQFKIEIASVPDREKVVVEIWYSNVLIAEINHENDDLEIQLYPCEITSMNFEDYMDALQNAKQQLLIG